MSPDETTHSELPPSSADKWFHCHAWRRQNAGLPDNPSPAAEEGTLAHKWLADHLEAKADLVDCPDPEMSDHLFLVSEWAASQEGKRYVEHRVDYGAQFGFVGLTGTSDLIFVTPKQIMIADLKYGRGVVEAPDNHQLLCYLVGAVQEFGRRPSYKIVILQPRAWHIHGPLRVAEISDDDLADFEQKLEVAIRGSYNPKSTATAGDWCRHYCKAFGLCKAAAARSLDLFRSEAA